MCVVLAVGAIPLLHLHSHRRFVAVPFIGLLLTWGMSTFAALAAWSSADGLYQARSNRDRLFRRILRGEPFAFYLRDYSPEQFKEAIVGPMGQTAPRQDSVEQRLAQEIGRLIPIYGLVNVAEQ